MVSDFSVLAPHLQNETLAHLHGLELAAIIVTKMLQDDPSGDTEETQPMQDRFRKASHGSKGRVNVQGIIITRKAVQCSLRTRRKSGYWKMAY